MLANNTDRKGGHCLHDEANDIVVGIDHGLTFHEHFKLRTVIWEFAGEQLPDAGGRRRAPSRRRARRWTGRGAARARCSPRWSSLRCGVRAANLLRDGLPYGDDHYSMPWPLV